MADFSLSADIKANAGQFVSELKKGETSLGNFGNIIDKVLGPKGKLITAIAAATAAAVKFGQQMNASMSEIAKGTGKTGEELYKLRENVHDALVNGVARSAQEVGKMIADLNTRFGVTGDELVKLTKEFDAFSKVTGVSTEEAIGATADVMAKWNIDISDTNNLLDQLTKASQDSGAGVNELLSGLKQGQAVFSQFGMSATDTIAFMGSLKQNGIEASSALVAMRTALAKFSSEGKEASEAFKEVSEKIKNAKTQTEALAIATDTFGTKNGAEMVKILQSGATSADAFKEKLLLAGGAVAQTEIAARTSKDALAELFASLKGTFGGLFEGLDTLFRGVVDSIKKVFQTLDPIIRPAINIVRDVLSTVGEMLTFISDQVGDEIQKGLGFTMLATVLQSVYETIHRILANMLESFKTAFGLIFAIINGKWDLAWEYLKKSLALSAKNILDLISEMINGIKDIFNVFIEKAINPLVDKWNWLAEKLDLGKAEKMELIGDVNLTELSGLEAQLEKINKKIKQLTGKTQEEITGNLGEIKTEIVEISEETEGTMKSTNKVTRNLKTGVMKALKKLGSEYADLTEKTEIWGAALENIAANTVTTLADAFGSVFTELGKELAENSLSWDSMTAAALEGISQVLIALGNELVALAAARAANYDYATAAAAAAGATAAFIAAGALSAVAEGFKKTSEAIEESASNLENFKETLSNWRGASNISDVVSSINEMRTALDAYINELASSQERYLELKKLGGLGLWYYGYIEEFNKLYSTIIPNLKTMISDTEETLSNYLSIVTNTMNETISSIKAAIATYEFLYTSTDKYITLLTLQLKESLLSVASELRDSMVDVGTDLGEILVDGIIDGASKTDFLGELKTYIKKYVIKLAIYTEEFADTMAEAGTTLVNALISGSTTGLSEARNQLEDLWDAAEERAKQAQNFLSEVFGDISDEASDLSETLAEIGDSMAENLIDALSDGLSESDFMDTMKNYIKSMVVQAVVYTEAIQAEIASIGKAISDGIANGFTETGLHEIRRDLSYIFNQANNAVSSIDTILSSVFSGYATGTDNATAGLHLVGEAGPELVRFKGGEQVYNAEQTASMLNNGNIGGNNFNITFNNLQDTSAFAMMQQLQNYQRQLAINGVI
jgi:TP901 family phage tail tape measure protein